MLQMRPPMFHCCATIPAVLLAASATQLSAQERPTNPPDTLTFPRSEVRLWKDRTEAVLTRIPEQ
jgi:hypothetical protein